MPRKIYSLSAGLVKIITHLHTQIKSMKNLVTACSTVGTTSNARTAHTSNVHFCTAASVFHAGADVTSPKGFVNALSLDLHVAPHNVLPQCYRGVLGEDITERRTAREVTCAPRFFQCCCLLRMMPRIKIGSIPDHCVDRRDHPPPDDRRVMMTVPNQRESCDDSLDAVQL